MTIGVFVLDGAAVLLFYDVAVNCCLGYTCCVVVVNVAVVTFLFMLSCN